MDRSPNLIPSSMFPAGRIIFVSVFSSLAFCADYQIEANIRYGQNPENVLDVVQSPAPALKNRPGVIVIHGDGDKERTLEQFCVPLAQHDFVVANVEYRSSEPAPTPISDVMAAAQWFHNHAARFKVDPNQILVLGEASGGTLALMLAMTPASAGLGPAIKIAAVINFYGVYQTEQPYAAYIRKGLPPILSVQGDTGDQSVRLTKALKEVGDDAELITSPGEISKLWPQIFKWLRKRKIGS